MISEQINKIEKEIVNILSNDVTIDDLLFFNGTHTGHASATDVVNTKIVRRPVFFNEGDSSNFISVHADNAVVSDQYNSYITTYKISCGCAHDSWLLPDGNARIYAIADRIEELLDGKKIAQSTGTFNLVSLNNVYWNEITTGVSLLFQVVESTDIQDGTIL